MSPLHHTGTIYDISVLLGVESITYPGDQPYNRKHTGTIAENGIFTVSTMAISTHAGTHVDAPAHCIQGSRNIEEYGADRFILPALVIPIKDRQSIKPEELKSADIKPGYALLFKTENSNTGRVSSGVYSKDYVGLSYAAADYCVEKKVGMVGIDYITIDLPGEPMTVHRKLLSNDVLILEGINLKDVPAGEYTLLCLPLKIKDGDGSPVRAVLVD
jgi:arylformamidase